MQLIGAMCPPVGQFDWYNRYANVVATCVFVDTTQNTKTHLTLTKCYDFQLQRLIIQFPAQAAKRSYHKQVHHNPRMPHVL